jgi:hypothetical protein
MARPIAVLVLAGLAGCSSSSGPPPNTAYRDTPYGRDVAHICNAQSESGASAEPEETRQLTIARWLPGVLETERAHDFLVTLVPMDAAAKAAALRAEARGVGLDGCDLASAWKPETK